MSKKFNDQTTKKFNEYIADLAVMSFKVYNIHWNAVGSDFYRVHMYTEEIFEETLEFMDQVAEHLVKFEITPASTLKEYLELATIKEIEPRPFECHEGLKIILEDLEYLRDKATEIRSLSDEEDWFSAVAMIEDQVDVFNKRIWFLRAMSTK
ncbi:MAG: DNA starvation/stationary phase protection protein [Eubacteriales bacterium]|nr:DNA starvation/stationary phase protection protein [Eubacteriales bacterium]